MLGALYTISLVDRSNISAARISGIDDDLGLAIGNRAYIVCKYSEHRNESMHTDAASVGVLHRIHNL